MTLVVYSSTFRTSPRALFEFHRHTANLRRISPPLPRVRVADSSQRTEAGDLQQFELGLGPFSSHWAARIRRVEPDSLIEDVQERGPFRRWRHQHRVTSSEDGARLTDVVTFRFFPGPAGELLDYFLVRPQLLLMFWWRHRRTRALLDGRTYSTRS